MKYFINIAVLLITISSAFSQSYVTYESYDDLISELLDHLDEDKTYVINYWATWCKPCVEELPLFEQITMSGDTSVEVILVSLDFPHQLESKFKPFLQERDLRSKVVLLLDGKYNDWIDKVDDSWSGAIPATLYIHNTNTYFHEGQYHSNNEILNDINRVHH